MSAEEIVERIMSAHWDMAACQCWICREGRKLGLSNRQKYVRESHHYRISQWGENKQTEEVEE
jgi:hypothetical protein